MFVYQSFILSLRLAEFGKIENFNTFKISAAIL